MNRDLETLHWLLCAPGLLRPSVRTPGDQLVGDAELREIFERSRSQIESLAPQELAAWLEASLTTRRLGRYVESLTEFAVRRFLAPSRVQLNMPIQEDGRTRGELDLLFESPFYSQPQHWELSVKFYICTAQSEAEAQDTRFYLGTFVEDRLDKKIEHLFQHQLLLTRMPVAETHLRDNGWQLPFENRALMKGLFFYPSDRDLVGLPDEVSPDHERGWWTTSRTLLIPKSRIYSRYVRLNQLQWLGRFQGSVAKEDALTKEQLEDEVRRYFEGDITLSGLRRRELTFAEVEIKNENEDGTLEVREISRGHFVHESWPGLARWASDRTFEQLEQSKKEHSKRPQT